VAEQGIAIQALGQRRALQLHHGHTGSLECIGQALRLGQAQQRIETAAPRWAVRAITQRLPWTTRCLIRALAASLIGRWHGPHITLYLGVSRESAG
jgi:hypothetical protein